MAPRTDHTPPPESDAGRPEADRLLRLPAVLPLYGGSQAQLYRDMNAGTFPRPVALGPNARAWLLSEIKAWQAERVKARDTGTDADMRAVNPNIGKGRRPKHQARHAA